MNHIRGVSGVRGIYGSSLNLNIIKKYLFSFYKTFKIKNLLLARDSRKHGQEILDFSVYDVRFFLNFFLVCSAMSFGTSIYIIASYRIGPVSASTFIFSVPFIAMGTAYIFIDESIGINIIIGGLPGILSTYFINYVKLQLKWRFKNSIYISSKF